MTGQRRSIVDAASAILNAELTASPPGSGGAFDRRDWSSAAAQVVQALNIPDLGSTEGRQRLHSLIDLIVDFLAATQSAAGSRLAAPSVSSADSAALAIPNIRARGAPARPGDEINMSVAVKNDETNTAADLSFFVTDLVASADRRIAAACVAISPATIKLPPGGSADVIIRLTVPTDGRPGTYQGLVLANGDDRLQAILTIRVAPVP